MAASFFFRVNCGPVPQNSTVVGSFPDGCQIAVTPAGPTRPLLRHVVIFEVEGGADKGEDGHRRDTQPLLAALANLGWTAEVLFYRDEWREVLLEQLAATADAYVSRVNPGSYAHYTEALYLDFCRQLHSRGILAATHPDTVLMYGAKDVLLRLAHTAVGLPDTRAYYDLASLRANFPASLAANDRVLKQNRGSTGEGIWVVRPHGWARSGEYVVDGNTLVACTEMVDNHTEVLRLDDFLRNCDQYVTGPGGQLVDQRFLPRISEGEIRVLMIADRCVSVVHKQPDKGQLSATLFSGARYQYDSVDEPRWQSLIQTWTAWMPAVRSTLGESEYPLLWTADFILDTGAGGEDTYRLGELNCTCVGFTTQLELAQPIAAALVAAVQQAKLAAPQPAPAVSFTDLDMLSALGPAASPAKVRVSA